MMRSEQAQELHLAITAALVLAVRYGFDDVTLRLLSAKMAVDSEDRMKPRECEQEPAA